MMAASRAMIADLERLVPGGVLTDVSLADISRWKIGGISDVIVRPESPEQVQTLRQYFFENSVHHIVIGMTSNLLFADEGLRVPCIQIGNRMGDVDISDGTVKVQAGAWVPSLARKIQKAGLTGAEHICGIPGSIGGLVYMNGGSQRKAIGSAIIEVSSIDEAGRERIRNRDECCFAYRHSAFLGLGEVIVQATMVFDHGSPDMIRKSMLKILEERRNKFPRKVPNCGSVFKSNPKLYNEIGPPGKVIELLGFKGFCVGGVMVSPVHANFFVNHSGATSGDVVTLIQKVRESVFKKMGFNLDSEVIFLDPFGKFVPVSEL